MPEPFAVFCAGAHRLCIELVTHHSFLIEILGKYMSNSTGVSEKRTKDRPIFFGVVEFLNQLIFLSILKSFKLFSHLQRYKSHIFLRVFQGICAGFLSSYLIQGFFLSKGLNATALGALDQKLA